MSSMYATIDRLCKEQGVNVTAMCRELKITRSALSELKSGRTRSLSSDYTAKIASYFNVSVDWLMGRGTSEQSPVQDELPLELRMIWRKLMKLPEARRAQILHLLESTTDELIMILDKY